MKQYYFFVPINKFPWLTSSLPPRADSFKRLARRVWTTSHYQVLFALFLAVFTISCGNGQSSQKLEAMQKNVNVVTINNIEPRRMLKAKLLTHTMAVFSCSVRAFTCMGRLMEPMTVRYSQSDSAFTVPGLQAMDTCRRTFQGTTGRCLLSSLRGI